MAEIVKIPKIEFRMGRTPKRGSIYLNSVSSSF